MAINPVMPDNAAVETTDYGEGAPIQEPTPTPEPTPPVREPADEPAPDTLPELPELPDEPDDEDEQDKASQAGKELATRKKGLEGRKQTIQEQINALVRERGEVTRETERGRAERAELQREIEALRSQKERSARGETDTRPPAPDGRDPGYDPRDPEPQEGAFQDYTQFQRALTGWAARVELRRDKYVEQQRAQASHRANWEAKRQEGYSTRYQAFAKVNPTFEQEINREDLLLTAPMVDAVKDSEQGPQMLLYLARNSHEIDRIAALHPVLAYGEMKKLEARLEGAHSGSPPPVAQHSKAPAPIKPVGNVSSRQSDGNDIPGDEVDVDEHIARMNKRDEQLRKRGLNPRRTYGTRL